jgi:hypothetical protein
VPLGGGDEPAATFTFRPAGTAEVCTADVHAQIVDTQLSRIGAPVTHLDLTKRSQA